MHSVCFGLLVCPPFQWALFLNSSIHVQYVCLNRPHFHCVHPPFTVNICQWLKAIMCMWLLMHHHIADAMHFSQISIGSFSKCRLCIPYKSINEKANWNRDFFGHFFYLVTLKLFYSQISSENSYLLSIPNKQSS